MVYGMNEIVVTIKVGQSSVVTSVYEKDLQGGRVVLGEGQAELNNRTEPASLREALINSLAEAERNARVDIQEVSVRVADGIDARQVEDILRSIRVEVLSWV